MYPNAWFTLRFFYYLHPTLFRLHHPRRCSERNSLFRPACFSWLRRGGLECVTKVSSGWATGHRLGRNSGILSRASLLARTGVGQEIILDIVQFRVRGHAIVLHGERLTSSSDRDQGLERFKEGSQSVSRRGSPLYSLQRTRVKCTQLLRAGIGTRWRKAGNAHLQISTPLV